MFEGEKDPIQRVNEDSGVDELIAILPENLQEELKRIANILHELTSGEVGEKKVVPKGEEEQQIGEYSDDEIEKMKSRYYELIEEAKSRLEK